MKEQKNTNRLIHETSPYLLQHAHNPVDWHPWNEETLKKAKAEDKMILVSIGYSACHWCHVMEHESFEDKEVARVMNAHFICIKVDREERPDVDQVYMDAVQMISGRGGWPLNCFALPDGRPVWGGTYFRRDQWLGILDNVSLLFKEERKKLEVQADEIFRGILQNAYISPDDAGAMTYPQQEADSMVTLMMTRIDLEHGGFRGAPKFPMPNNFQFLLRYQHHSGNREVLAAVELTLEKMAKGGIYDQIGGGFSRYSVDDRWHVPHFEKMLYDNAQLVSLYAEAYRLTKNPLFGEVVSETLAFINRELTSPEGEFYAALDADSEGVEGRFYVWKKELFENVLGDDAGILSGFFGIGREAYWEDENNVLVRVDTPAELALKYQMDEREAGRIIERGRQKLFHARSSRVRPGLDDKVLTSWNALMLKAYIDAYRALNKQEYLDRALLNAGFLSGHMIGEDGKVMRTYKEGVAAIDGFLDDYSFLVEAFIALYQITFDERWLNLAKLLADFTIRHFYDPATHMFFYTSDFHKDSVVRKIEVADGVMPASCSSLARGLFSLGLLYEHHVYTEMAVGMLNRVQQNMQRYPTAFSNWGILFLHLAFPYHTVVITGPRSAELLIEMTISYSPNVLFAGGSSPSGLPVCKNRWDSERTQIYVCTGSECQLPVQSVREAMDLIEKAGG